MKKIYLGILLWIFVGVLDAVIVHNTFTKRLSLDAIVSVLLFWFAGGLFILTTTIKIQNPRKGILISLVLLIPLAVIIKMNLTPILIINIVCGGFFGFLVTKYGKN